MPWTIEGSTQATVAPVVIKSGSGQNYTIDVYGDGIHNSPTEQGASAVHPRISGSETIPAGTVTYACKAGGVWHLMEATWL